jgi:hypothetical protein
MTPMATLLVTRLLEQPKPELMSVTHSGARRHVQ